MDEAERDKMEEVLAQEMEEEDMIMLGDYVGDQKKFCTDCTMTPCTCLLTYLDLKLESLRRMRSRNWEQAGTEEDAAHQHQR